MFLAETVELTLSPELQNFLFESLKFFLGHFACLLITRWL